MPVRIAAASRCFQIAAANQLAACLRQTAVASLTHPIVVANRTSPIAVANRTRRTAVASPLGARAVATVAVAARAMRVVCLARVADWDYLEMAWDAGINVAAVLAIRTASPIPDASCSRVHVCPTLVVSILAARQYFPKCGVTSSLGWHRIHVRQALRAAAVVPAGHSDLVAAQPGCCRVCPLPVARVVPAVAAPVFKTCSARLASVIVVVDPGRCGRWRHPCVDAFHASVEGAVARRR